MRYLTNRETLLEKSLVTISIFGKCAAVLWRICQLMRFAFSLKRMKTDTFFTESHKTELEQRAENFAKEQIP